MLAIRLQRIGKAHHAMYRLIVQDSHRTPTSGNVVAQVGSYNPHNKEVTVDAETAQKFLDHGAQPTSRVAQLLASNGVKLPKWFKATPAKSSKIRHPEKLRKNQPKEEPTAEAITETSAESEATPTENV